MALLRVREHGPTIAGTKRNSFDSLRLFFAILVIYSHSFPLTLGDNSHEPLARIASPPLVPGDEITLGAIGVWSFFVISGFLITQSWLRSSSPWSYLKKRIRRIYPGFVVAVLVCVLIQAFVAGEGQSAFPNGGNFLSQTMRLRMFDSGAIFVHNPVPNALNGSLWSIQYEFWCYLGVILLGTVGLLRNRYVLAIALLAVVGFHTLIDYLQWLPGGMFWAIIFGYPLYWTRVLPFFLAGMFLCIAQERIELRRSYALISLVLVVLATPLPYLPYLVYPIFGSYLLMYVAFSPVLLPLNLGRWGDFSYGTYLYAFPIQQLLVYSFEGRLSATELFLLATPLAVVAGALSWFVVERRFLSRIKEKKREQRGSETMEIG